MHADLIIALLQNATLLLALLAVLDLTVGRRRARFGFWWDLVAGLMLGGLCIGLMAAAFPRMSGVIFDTRSILVSLAGLFLGPWPTLVAGGVAALFRWAQGGAGMGMGLGVIALSGLIGVGWRKWRGVAALPDLRPLELLGFGLVVHAAMLAATGWLPAEVRGHARGEIALPLFTVYPVTTVIVGALLARRLRRERLQAELTESEGRYRSLFENNHAVMLLVDPDSGAIVDANPAAVRYYGWTQAEFVRRRVTDLNTADEAEVRRAMERAGREENHLFEFVHRRADGSVRDVEVVSGPITVAGRRLLYSIVHDVTQRRQVQERLRESERLFREIFLANPFPMWVYDRETLAFLAVNDAAVAHYGYSREQFLGMTIRDIRPAEDIPRLLASVARSADGVEQAGEWRHRLADGRLVDVEITSHELPFGERPGKLVLAQDISERRAAERAVRESEQRLRLALQAAQQGIYDLDLETGVAIVTPEYATMLGYDPQEFRETNAAWTERLHPEDRAPVRRIFEDYLAGRRPEYRVEFRQLTRSGTWKWILSLGCVVERDAQDRPRRMLGTHTDITAAKESEQQVADALALTEAVISSSPIGIITYDDRGQTVSVNPAAAAMVGATEAELLRLNFHAIESWRGSGMLDGAGRALATGTRVQVETELVTSFGRALSLAATFVPFQFRGEWRLLLLMRDITESRRALAALSDSERRWQFALEGAGDGVWDWDVPSGRVFYSPRWMAMLGFGPDECAGNYGTAEGLIHPEDRSPGRAALEDCLTGRTESYEREMRFRCKDGSYKWILSRGRVVERDAAGGPIRMIGTHADLTERRRTAERLNLLDTAIQAMPWGVLITTRDGVIEQANPGFCRMSGYALGEVLGRTPRLLKSDRQPPEFYTRLWQTILAGENWNGELINRRRDGAEYPERMTIAPVKHGGTRITHFIAIKQDITEEKRLERQFLRSQRMESIGLLAGGIAHDLNNVLAPILLSVELLRAHRPDAAQDHALALIEASARRGTGVVRQVLTFARGIDGDRTPVRPGDLLREFVVILEETFPRHIEIRRQVEPGVPTVLGDTTQLHQVLLNLAVNARDAMPQGGILTLDVRPVVLTQRFDTVAGPLAPGRYVLFTVRDTGSGMSPETRDRLFEPFYTTKPLGKGTGLGLPTVLGIVRSHGGGIEVHSAPGAGAEFRVYLPALAGEAGEPPVSAAWPDLRGEGRCVLICDDEPAVREIAGRLLRQQGFVTLEAENGREAMTTFVLHRTEIHAVISDIMMPLMTGDRAAAEMLRLKPDLPILFMSGLLDQDTLATALRQVNRPAVPLLRKPFTVPELLAALGRILPSPSSSSSP